MRLKASQTSQNIGALKLFPAKAPLESVRIGTLVELVRTARGFRYLLVIMDRFTKLVRTVFFCGITDAKVVKQFVNHWVFLLRTPY